MGKILISHGMIIFIEYFKHNSYIYLSPVHMRWFTHGMQIIHICIICTRVYFWACERNCIYVKVNLHMCKYTPPCKYTPAQTRCIFAFTCMYFIHICIFGHVNAQQITPVCKCKISSYSSKIGSKNNIFLCLNRKIL